MKNPYVDEGSGVYANKLGIRDPSQLRDAEYTLTDLRIVQLMVSPPAGRYDLAHLSSLHAHIFQDIYEWAGQVRTINFSKLDPVDARWKTVFAPHQKIGEIANMVATDLASWRYLRDFEHSDFAAAMSVVYVKLNHMHPFPEGNGRATQTFLWQLARQAGYDLDFARIEPLAWNVAAARSMPQRSVVNPNEWRQPDVSLLQEAFRTIASPLRDRSQDFPERSR